MLWRSPKKPLTRSQQIAYAKNLDRLLKRWRQRGEQITSFRYACLCANARCLALHPERFSSAHGARLMRQREAKAAHKAIRMSGRIPAQEGRAQIERNRAARKMSGSARSYGQGNRLAGL